MKLFGTSGIRGKYGEKITEQLATFLGKAGVDILELGVPFSDPLARRADHTGRVC